MRGEGEGQGHLTCRGPGEARAIAAIVPGALAVRASPGPVAAAVPAIFARARDGLVEGQSTERLDIAAVAVLKRSREQNQRGATGGIRILPWSRRRGQSPSEESFQKKCVAREGR